MRINLINVGALYEPLYLTQSVTKYSCPAWLCPECHKGTVALILKSLVSHETAESKRAHKDEDWYPERISYTFSAWGECRHPSCKQQFVISGTGGIASEYGPDGDLEWEDYFSPLYCHPMPDIIELPAKCPTEVKEELRAAFSIFWLHRAACAGRIRVALEYLMNHLGVPKRKKDKSGKYSDLTLHARLDSFAKDEPTMGPQLMALKWLGNTGSHDREVTKGDLLDAFEILEHALVEIIEGRSARVAGLAKKLTKKHAH
jgi:hypothetical protein